MTDASSSPNDVRAPVPATLPAALPKTVPGPLPGTVPRKRYRPRVDFELIACGLHGHEFIGLDASEVRASDAIAVRETDGLRWHRCLRCDAWVPFEIPATPATKCPPDVADVTVPMRGKRLRDHYVLRLIVLDRIVHSIVLGAIAVLIFLFAEHRSNLHADYVKVITALQANSGSFFVEELNKLFSLKVTTLYLLGLAVAVYVLLLIIEAVGLWNARRWAEYLTLVETGLLLPYEIYELTSKVTTFRVGAFLVNLAIVLYLLLAHRLFGLRGGRLAALAEYGLEG